MATDKAGNAVSESVAIKLDALTDRANSGTVEAFTVRVVAACMNVLAA